MTMGNPHEPDYFYTGSRDPGQGAPRERDLIENPARGPQQLPREKQAEFDEMFYRVAEMLKKQVFFSKRPAFVEPPFHSTPIIKTIRRTITAGTTSAIFDRDIPDRHRAMISVLGVDTAPILPVNNGQVLYWFSNPGAGSTTLTNDVIPVFDDQTTGLGGRMGQSSVIPGSVAVPFNFMDKGLAFQVRGPKRLVFAVQNNSAADIVVRGILGYYQYRLEKASEFEGADIQL